MGNRTQTVIAAVTMIVIAAGSVLFGMSLRAMGERGRADVRDLAEHGRVAVVVDARANLLTNRDDRTYRVNRLEVTFPDADGTKRTMATLMPPNLDEALVGGGPDGWFAEFPGKETIVGTHVRYILGKNPRAQLESELATSNATSWEFVDYLGTAMWGLGALIGAGALMMLAVKLRSRPRAS